MDNFIECAVKLYFNSIQCPPPPPPQIPIRQFIKFHSNFGCQTGDCQTGNCQISNNFLGTG